MDLYEKLKNKGWSDEEINRAQSILKFGKSNQKNLFSISTKTTYWIGLFMLIIFNAILSSMLVPFLILVKHPIAYVFIIIFASGFGYVFNFLLKDIQFTDPKHHVIAGVFIPAIAVINIYVVVSLTNYFFEQMFLNVERYSPVVTSFIYVISFMTPYFYTKVPGIVDIIFRKAYKTN